jgi:hypothetical protein
MAQTNISGQDSRMDRIALLEQQIAALKEQRESLAELRDQYIGFLNEVRSLKQSILLTRDVLRAGDPEMALLMLDTVLEAR